MSAATETVNQTANATDAGAPATSEAAAPAERKYEGHRVYVGNLSFKATEEQVRELADKAEGEVIEVTLPLKFKRPSGYAFIAFKTEEQAQNALEKLKEEEIDGRPVKLQLARSPEEQNERRAALDEKRKADKDAKAAEKAAARKETEAAAGEGEAAAAKPKKKRTAKKAPRRRVPGQDDEEAEGQATENPDASDVTAVGVAPEKAAKPKRKNNKSRKAREARIDGATEVEETAAPAEAKPKKEKKPRQPRQQPTGEPSATTVFVANLPFDVDDEGLASIFTNLSIRVKSAKVVVGVRRNRDGKTFRASRGFGFVEVEDPAQQQEAVDKVEGTTISDRTLSAKIANEMKPAEEEEVAEAVKEESEAPAASA